jgi:hypothetical protein
MSISSRTGDPRCQAIVARAGLHFKSLGLEGRVLQCAMRMIIRYVLGRIGPALEHVPDAFFDAVATIATRQLPDLLAGNVHETIRIDRDASFEYWLETTCALLDIDSWLDDSLERWFLDQTHPFADYMVQACRGRVFDHLAICLGGSSIGLDLDEVIQSIAGDLSGKFPLLGRFTRHLCDAIRDTIETSIIGTPIEGPAGYLNEMPVDVEMAEMSNPTGQAFHPGDIILYQEGIPLVK